MSFDKANTSRPEGLERSNLVGRLLRLALVAIVLGAGGYAVYRYWWKDEAPAPVAAEQVATVTAGRLVSTLATTGTAQASLSSRLTFSSSGQVKSVFVKIGDAVTAGQELALLDDKDALRKVETAKSSLETARLRLQQLTQPAQATDIASGQQAVASARQGVASAEQGIVSNVQQIANAENSLATAKLNLEKAKSGPTLADLATADASVVQAETALGNARNQVDNAYLALRTAQRTYCDLQTGVTTSGLAFPTLPCFNTDLPLSARDIQLLTDFVRFPGGNTGPYLTAAQAANGFVTTNTSYVSAVNAVPSAEANLAASRAKRADLLDGPTALELEQLTTAVRSTEAALESAKAGTATARAAVETAKANLTSAEAKLDVLVNGTTAASTDVAIQQQSVRQAEIGYQQALEAVDALVLRAPFDGVIGTVGVVAGDTAGTGTAVFTLTNPNAIRVDLTVQEADYRGLKAGQFGLATFDAVGGQTYYVRITAVGNTPTVTQGVVTYPVQAEILQGESLRAAVADVQRITEALGTGGLGRGRAGPGAGPGAQGAGPGGGGGAAAGRTPPAGLTPGAGRPGGAQGQGGPGAGGLTAVLPTPGMNANVTMVLEIQDNQLLVPTTAIRRQGTASTVLLKKEDGTTEQRQVQAGGTDGTNTAIVSGLAAGDQVVIRTAVAAGATPTARAGQAGPGGGVQGTGGIR